MDTNTNRYDILSVLLFLSIALLVFFSYSNIHAQQQQNQPQGITGITLSDPNLKLELVTSGLDFPTTMAFLGPDDFLILEKSGTVKRVTNGKVLDKPLLQVDVSEKDERGLLGIAVSEKKKENSNGTSIPNKDMSHNVFLYYIICNEKNEDCKNQIYRYDLDNKNNVLVNPKLLLSIPSFPDPYHIDGIIRIGPDNNLYVTMGNFQNSRIPLTIKNKALNFEDGNDLDGRSGILRMTQDGKPVNDGNDSSIIGDNYPLNLYYAYGIRNSFGLDFDPLTDKLWDTEIGPEFGDEINLVEPGFNSGADKIYGIWKNDGLDYKLKEENKSNKSKSEISFVIVNETKPENLVYLGKGHYNLPKFIWEKKVTPTALVFLDSKSLGKKYRNEMFVGSSDNGGNLFHFELNKLRDDLILKGNLSDRIATDKNEYEDILFAEGFNLLTDLKVGPYDGYLYIVSSFESNDSKAGIVSKTEGSVFRIVPTKESTIKSNND